MRVIFVEVWIQMENNVNRDEGKHHLLDPFHLLIINQMNKGCSKIKYPEGGGKHIFFNPTTHQ